MIFERWQDVIAKGKVADAVLIGLQVSDKSTGSRLPACV